MPRYKLVIEYDGTPFVGWQRQDNGPSVQESLERAIEKFCGQRIAPMGAGRTDSGVHALGQVAHIDLDHEARPDKIRDALNYHLKPDPIAVLSAELVSDEFHARFNAKRRHYLYRISTRRPPLTLEAGRAWQIHKALDTAAMHEAAQYLVGDHDFTTFRAASCQAKSPVKTIDKISVNERGDEIHIAVSAPSFLQHQVRSIAGTLKLVGEANWTTADVKQALEARDRAACGPIAPPEGLYLVRVDYD